MTKINLTGKLNELNYLMISDELHQYLWPELYTTSEDGEEPEGRPKISKMTQAEIKAVFNQFGDAYQFPPEAAEYPPLELELPEMPDFRGLAEKEWGWLSEAILKFTSDGVPPVPEVANIHRAAGWTRYEYLGKTKEDVFEFTFDDSDKPLDEWAITKVANPLESTLVFDVETFVKADNLAVMAVAVSNKAWYFWFHPSVIDPRQHYQGQLISLGYGKVVINHNPKFDSARVQETYDFTSSEPRNIWLDTLSMHMACSGMSNKQRVPYMAYLKGEATHSSKWASKTSGNSLIAVYNLHVNPLRKLDETDKSSRNLFVVASHCDQFNANLDELIGYTLLDGKYTSELAQVLIPKYLKSQPSLYTLGGHACLSQSFLPVPTDFKQRLFKIEQKYLEVKKELISNLSVMAKDLVSQFIKGDLNPQSDPWLSQLDWTPAKTGATKGQPAWWRKLKGKKVTVKSTLAPILLRISWKGKPIFKTRDKGWIYPCEAGEHGAFPRSLGGYELFARIPHPKGDKNNCGSPLGKDYIKELGGNMSSPVPNCKEYLEKAKSIAYWSSMRKRAFEYNPQPIKLPGLTQEWSMIEPMLLSHGTASRRCVESLWLTVSGVKTKKGDTPEQRVIGSELKGLVRPPKGYVMVGADFDAQEMKIASAYADAWRHQIFGSTPMSYTNLLGDKDKKTDSHTLLAVFLEFLDSMGRDIAKNLNFSMLYLSGEAGCAGTIKSQRLDLSETECKLKARSALKLRRGSKVRSRGDHFEYKGGTDSNAYNFMLTLGNGQPMPRHLSHLNSSKVPRTPMLSSAMSEAITYENCGGDYLTSRANWNVQSTGADILHFVLVALKYLFREFQIQGWFQFSYHDELWFLVAEEDKLKAAWCLQVAHLWAWTYLFKRLGFKDLPFQYMFFSGVNLDRCFRKEVNHTQLTPSNSEEVPFGENLNIYKLVNRLTQVS